MHKMHFKWRCMWNTDRMILIGENRINWRKTCINATFATVYVTWSTPRPVRSKAHLGPLAFSDFGFECCWEHGYLSAASVVWCQVDVYATGWSLVQGSPTDCVCMSLSVIRCNIDLLHLHWAGRRGRTKKERKRERNKQRKSERKRCFT